MNDMHKEIIGRHWKKLKKDLEGDKVLLDLMEKGIFIGEDQTQIEQKQNRHEKNNVLLNILLKKDPDAFSAFVEILRSGTQWFFAYDLLKAGR